MDVCFPSGGCWRDCFFPTQWPCGGLFLGRLFHWSVSLSDASTVYCFNYYTFAVSFEIRRLESSNLFFFVKIVLSPLRFQMNFRVGLHACMLSHVRLFGTPPDCSPPGSCVHGILLARTLEWVDFLLQEIFPTQGSNPFLHQQADSLPLYHPGSPSMGLTQTFNTFISYINIFT